MTLTMVTTDRSSNIVGLDIGAPRKKSEVNASVTRARRLLRWNALPFS